MTTLFERGAFDCVAVVSTTLHALYVAEFAFKFNVKTLHVIVLIKRTTDERQLRSILDEIAHSRVDWVYLDSFFGNKFISIFELLSLQNITWMNSYTYGVFCDYGRSLLANLPCKEYWWLGDGTKYLYQNSRRFKAKSNRFHKQKRFQKLVRLVTGKNLYLSDDVHSFSPFSDGSCGERNDFGWLKGVYEKRGVTDACNAGSVYFFGAYFCEVDGKKIMGEAEYLDVIRKIYEYYLASGLTFIYVPHRHESEDKLRKIEKIIRRDVSRFSFPAEYQFVDFGFRPAEVASFFSTCLFHFKLIFPSVKITSFYVDISASNSDFAQQSELYYDELRKVIGEDNVISLNSLNSLSNKRRLT